MRLLFLGDVMGRTGRDAVSERLPGLIADYGFDFVVVNGENASHGRGLTENHYAELRAAGADAVTLGDHAWDQRDTLTYIEREPVLLVGYDAPYPQPLHATRPIAAEFGVALVLAPRPTARSIARIDASIAAGEAQILDDAPLEALRRGVPAARSLPLLAALALGMPRVTTVEYLDSDGLRVQVSPCD